MDQQCQDYVAALEAERRKILVFQTELPLSLKLVTETIEACRKQLVADEATSNDGGPVLEEFIPLNPSLSWTEEEEEEEETVAEEEEKRSDWLRSVQLWNQQPEPEPEPPKKLGGAFHPFEKVKLTPEDRDVQESCSSETTTFTRGERPSRRKPRRCWSPELHRRFLNALQQLGGSHVATPKQIKELINVDGLTNDEVKSHLQKYRLHTKRPGLQNSSMHQGTQFVIVDGIWVPPAEYAAIAAAAAAAAAQPTNAASCDSTHNAIYAPKASLPPGCTSHKIKNLSHALANPLGIEGRCGEDVDGVVEVNATSPASASSDTVTASPPS